MGIDPESLAQRREREARSLEAWTTKTMPQLRSLEDLHTWLFSEHACYAVAKQGTAADTAVAAMAYGGGLKK